MTICGYPVSDIADWCVFILRKLSFYLVKDHVSEGKSMPFAKKRQTKRRQ